MEPESFNTAIEYFQLQNLTCLHWKVRWQCSIVASPSLPLNCSMMFLPENLEVPFWIDFFSVWKGRGSQGFTCHLMVLLSEYVNVAFSLQIFLTQNIQQKTTTRKILLGQIMLYYLSIFTKNANCHSKQRNSYSEFSSVFTV